MQDAFSRMELLVGNTGVKKLSRAKIAVFGLGGAGSQVAESLARCGVGSLTLIDHEKITLTNIGSQVLALHSTLGMSKVEAAKKRIRDIDENILVHTYETFYNEETAGMFELRSFDYIVDTMERPISSPETPPATMIPAQKPIKHRISLSLIHIFSTLQNTGQRYRGKVSECR